MISQNAVIQGGAKLERVYELIRQRIGDGTYRPGERLVLDKIARELSVSAVPVREALRRLEAEGYVEYERNIGARVATIDPAEYVPTMHILAYLEGYATVTSARRVSTEVLARAAAINDEMRLLAGTNFDPFVFADLNRRFHTVLISACPHQHLLDLIETEWDRLDSIRRSAFMFASKRSQGSVAEHDELIMMISTGSDGAEIELKARLHKLHTIDAVLATGVADALHQNAGAVDQKEPTS